MGLDAGSRHVAPRQPTRRIVGHRSPMTVRYNYPGFGRASAPNQTADQSDATSQSTAQADQIDAILGNETDITDVQRV